MGELLKKYIAMNCHNSNKLIYSAMLDHDHRFGNVLNTDGLIMKYIVLYHPKFSMLRSEDIHLESYRSLRTPLYHADKEHGELQYILKLDNPYIRYKDLESDCFLNYILKQTQGRLFVIYNSQVVKTYIQKNDRSVHLLADTYCHQHDYDKIINILQNDQDIGVVLSNHYVDLCSRLREDQISMNRIFLDMKKDRCFNCSGRKRCARWKARHKLPVKHYADWVTTSWEYRPKFSDCYWYMNENVKADNPKLDILDLSACFGLVNFLVDDYNKGMYGIVDLFAQDHWKGQFGDDIEE